MSSPWRRSRSRSRERPEREPRRVEEVRPRGGGVRESKSPRAREGRAQAAVEERVDGHASRTAVDSTPHSRAGDDEPREEDAAAGRGAGVLPPLAPRLKRFLQVNVEAGEEAARTSIVVVPDEASPAGGDSVDVAGDQAHARCALHVRVVDAAHAQRHCPLAGRALRSVASRGVRSRAGVVGIQNAEGVALWDFRSIHSVVGNRNQRQGPLKGGG